MWIAGKCDPPENGGDTPGEDEGDPECAARAPQRGCKYLRSPGKKNHAEDVRDPRRCVELGGACDADVKESDRRGDHHCADRCAESPRCRPR